MVELEITHDSRATKWVVAMLAVFIAWFLIAYVIVPRVQYKNREAQVKQNLHVIQLALERFAVDSPGQNYPVRLEELREQGYLPQMPLNPFQGRPMHGTVLDCHGRIDDVLPRVAQRVKGDFVYFRRRYPDEPDGPIVGYTLLAF